jgi:hypothetical protein
LIPKAKNANTFDRFHPISLCNVSYKILTKIIANRIKHLLPRIILPNQGGFVTKRQIWDNIILVQEAIHTSVTNKEKGMIIKIDMANAFDRVKHEFLFDVLNKFGFHSSFVSWIKACISSPWIASLINGCPTPFFQATRGLRQGCPLSPLLYVIMAETLNRRLEQERATRNIPGLKIARGVRRINNSQFVDDTLLLGGASQTMARRFKLVLDQYEQASGGLINKLKSQIYAWNIKAGTMARIANILQFSFTTDWKYFKYLGTPISIKSLPGEAWQVILQKLKDQFEIWGATWLNPAGRVVLIKAVLSSFPIFQFSPSMLQWESRKKWPKLQGNFFGKEARIMKKIPYGKLGYYLRP